ncbi:helix-turn-helix transcriptional regulator [Acaryochloris sp. 'Moss Beach']|uniref:PadR family transcriptional regulator n=1 Tax=Acaryochloris TaxID=155977 RepID=UPI001BB0B445|nr:MULTISPECIES: helix-turn-helix transcriptional regulator [Acaryochloris]QUY43685.1 helix-turn-helix transcriptional regulator [Acaryochloris marina S15]UJB68474.1 helix-turn-helix transcriptional regulator [Acaryochloris sp. 'Moss Beach']
MNVQDIHQYFKNPPPVYITKEVAVCYILTVLLEEGDSYGTALLKHIRANHPPYRISDTVLYAALNFLIDEEMLSGYWQNESGRGRPRRMYQVAEGREKDAQNLSQLWLKFLGKDPALTESLVLT